MAEYPSNQMCVCVCVCVCGLASCVLCGCVLFQCVGVSTLADCRLKTIGLKTLMERLTNRELYPLAIALCSFLKYSPDEGEIPVLMHWAKKRVRTRLLLLLCMTCISEDHLLNATLSGDGCVHMSDIYKVNFVQLLLY